MTHILRVNEMFSENETENNAIKQNLIRKIKSLIKANGGYFEVPEEDVENLQICNGVGENGEDEGEWFCVLSINNDGVTLDCEDDNFYNFDDLTTNDLEMLIDYIEEA